MSDDKLLGEELAEVARIAYDDADKVVKAWFLEVCEVELANMTREAAKSGETSLCVTMKEPHLFDRLLTKNGNLIVIPNVYVLPVSGQFSYWALRNKLSYAAFSRSMEHRFVFAWDSPGTHMCAEANLRNAISELGLGDWNRM